MQVLWTLQISLLRTFPDPRDCSTEDLAAFITKPLQSPCRSTPEGSTGICICTLSSCLRPLPPLPLPEPLQPALPGTGYGPWCSLCDSSCHVCACQSRPPLPCMCPHCHANVICPKPASGLYKKGLYKESSLCRIIKLGASDNVVKMPPTGGNPGSEPRVPPPGFGRVCLLLIGTLVPLSHI